VTRALRSELLKMRTMPGMWVVLLLTFPLTALFLLVAFGNAGSHEFPQQTFAHVSSLTDRRLLLGAGFRAVTLLAPLLGVLCVTTEYRHKTITGTLLLTPQRSHVLVAKIMATSIWAIAMVLITFVTVAAVGLPWNAAMGGSVSSVTDQAGAVLPELLVATILLALFGVGFGTLVKNQIAGVLVTIGGTLILEPIIVALATGVFHYNLNWLPNEATAAFAGILTKGLGFGGGGGGGGGGGDGGINFRLLEWWAGGIIMAGWGLVPLTIGYFTTFRKDVT
jgi:ABC-2 type transport system permease protein